MRRRGLAALAVLLGGLGLTGLAAPGPRAHAPVAGADAGLIARGRALFVDGCSSCHGLDARGRPQQGPSLVGVGAAAADFYLSTGRMPLPDPRSQPLRAPPAYGRSQIRALVAYVGSLGGPPIPVVDPGRGRLNAGLAAFTEHCAGCHQVVGRGGIVTGAIVPPLQQATPTQIAEAVRTGPYVMPRFSTRQIDDRTLDDIVRYVRSTRHPDNRGGWGIGNLGPIPEGMVAWLLAGSALLLVARLIGERTR